MNNPKVIRTYPSNEQKNVETDLKKLVIEFNKPMAQSYAFISGYKELDYKRGHWENETTFCVNVEPKLKPSKEYIIYLNSPQKLYFRDKQGNPLLPTALIFKTK